MRLLITDDEKNLRQVLRKELARKGIEIDDAENGVKALELLDQNEYDVVLLDLKMPHLGGIDVLKKIKSCDLPVEVIILTANATISSAVEAMKLGAYDYLTKPFRLEELWPIVEKAYEKKKLRSENSLLKTQLKRQSQARTIVAQSAVMMELMDKVRKVASSDFPVLITGESGVGKELVARAIHDASKVSEGPFVPINCGALPESMIESELFGFEKGAFTGAAARKPGLLEMADNGTLFLDEIGDMPYPLQVKLLRVIESGCFYRLGGARELRVTVRVLSATNKNLQALAAEGTFRQDLFYRIAALMIHVPALREHTEDIPLLIDNCITVYPMFKHKHFSKEALKLLMTYPWPGNVRELQNVVHRALLLSRQNVIEPSDLPLDVSGEARAACTLLEDVEREHILKVLKESGGQRRKAAEKLGIDTKTLYRKLLSYGVKE
jgi:DNA-binding NtrC family response regulator